MKIETAREVLQAAMECSRKADESAARVKDACDEHTSRRYSRLVGQIMGNIFTEILVPIYEQHPALAPDWYKPGGRAQHRGAALEMTASLRAELVDLMDQIYSKTYSLVERVGVGSDLPEATKYRSRTHEILLHVAEAKFQLLSANTTSTKEEG